MDDKFITSGQAAKILGLTTIGVIKAAGRNKLPHLRVGDRRLYKLEDVEKYKMERENRVKK